jgi:hypothetical protein
MFMVDERQLLLEKVFELEKKLEAKDKAKGERGFSKYMELGAFYANVPHDPYSHQYQLINKPGKKVAGLPDMLDPDILLSNIQDSKTMFFCQRDYYFLSRFRDMGERSEGVMNVWRALYYPWVGQMRMTSAMGGRERNLQSFLDITGVPSESFGLGFWEKRKMKKEQKKQGVQRYLTPQGQGGIYE